jgi:hypothetical protein
VIFFRCHIDNLENSVDVVCRRNIVDGELFGEDEPRAVCECRLRWYAKSGVGDQVLVSCWGSGELTRAKSAAASLITYLL